MTAGWRKAWEEYRERPFARLVRLSLYRMLHGAQDDSDDFDADLGRTLTILAIPGGFLSLALLDKYGSLLHWLRGQKYFDPYAAALSDEYFFIVLSMAVCAAVAVWKADAIFLDRRDYLNLVPLPVRSRSILLANLVALGLFSLLFAVDVNLASGWLFPLVVTAAEGSIRYWLVMTVSHVAGVFAASLFSFMCVFAVVGSAMAVLPVSLFRRVTTYLSTAIVIATFALLATGYSLSSMLEGGANLGDSWMRFLPSFWFLGLAQEIRSSQTGGYIGLAKWSGVGLAVATIVAVVAYAVSYRRHFVRTAENVEGAGSVVRDRWFMPMGLVLDAIILKTPFERAGFRFVLRTLARSARHRLAIAACAGMAIVAIVQALSGTRPITAEGSPSVEWLAIELILSYCLIVGLRSVFDMPMELRANWTFQLLVEPGLQECIPLARKVILTIVLGLVWTLGFAFSAFSWGWRVALIHSIVVSFMSVLLTDLLLAKFHKIPFTCTYPAFRQGWIVSILSVIFGFSAFAFGTATVERWAFDSGWRFLVFVPLLVAVWYGLSEYRANLVDRDRELTFEEQAPHAVELLNLSAGQ